MLVTFDSKEFEPYLQEFTQRQKLLFDTYILSGWAVASVADLSLVNAIAKVTRVSPEVTNAGKSAYTSG